MRNWLKLLLAASALVLSTGCGGANKPAAPEGYVDPGTDPAAMSTELGEDAPQ